MAETQNQKEQSVTAPQVNPYDEIEKQYKTKQQELNQNVNDLAKKQDEERKKEAKKQRTRQIINSVADGVSAIANLVGTAHGAPNMYSGENLFTAKSAERYNKYYTNAEARRNAYLQAMKTKGNEELSNWYTMQKDKLKADIEDRKQKVNEAKEHRLQLESDAKLVILSHKASEADAQALIAAAQAGNADEYFRLKNKLIESQIAKNYGNANGNKGGNKGFITVHKKKPALDENGNVEKDRYGNIIYEEYETQRLYVGTPEYEEHIRNQGNDKNPSTKGNNNKTNPTGKTQASVPYK